METKTAASGFAALAQETRLQLMRVLATKGAGMSAGQLATELQQAPSTLSFHLSALEQAGLVRSTRKGRQVIYTVRMAGLRSLFGFLTETCCNGRPDLCVDLARLIPDDNDDEVPSMQPAFNVLFLCTRNSARSIMAEAIMEKIGRGRFNVYSAGTDPAEAPMPEVLERLRAFGHDVGHLRSKAWVEFTGPEAPRMDFVITLCDVPEGEACPDLGARAITASWPFPDPAKFMGSEVERATLLSALYGMIRRRLELFASLPFGSLSKMALKARLDELGDSSRMPR